MNRVIKFRAWIAKDGVMFSDGDLLADFFTWLDQWKESKGPYVLMQSTGLFDNNDVEVFEGDIVMMAGDDEPYPVAITLTVDRDFNGWEITPQDIINGTVVIGNIYQDSNLLK